MSNIFNTKDESLSGVEKSTWMLGTPSCNNVYVRSCTKASSNLTLISICDVVLGLEEMHENKDSKIATKDGQIKFFQKMLKKSSFVF